MDSKGRRDRQPGQSWIVDAYRRENGRYPIGESICKLREPARSRAANAVFDLLTRGVQGWREGSKSFKFPDAKPIGENLWEVSRKRRPSHSRHGRRQYASAAGRHSEEVPRDSTRSHEASEEAKASRSRRRSPRRRTQRRNPRHGQSIGRACGPRTQAPQ